MLNVENGWLGQSEINTVTYDTDRVTRDQLESWLKRSGIYIRTVPSQREK